MPNNGSLATVIEHLPLCYNTDTKSLDRAPSRNSGSSSELPFKRGHIRRSSYESAQIQLNFARRMTTPHNSTVPTVTQCPVTSLCSPHAGSSAACGSSASSSEVNDYDSITEDYSIQPLHYSSRQDDESSKGVFFKLPRLFSRSASGKSWFFGKGKSKESVLIRTTGLILEERPSSLPAKPSDEAARHKQLYYDMIEQMKKKEQRALKELRQAHFEKVRLEEQAKSACQLWMEKILPNWNETRDTKRCFDLWWQGIPPKIRGQVWSLVIGNDLDITPELYQLNCAKAACDTLRESRSDQESENVVGNECSTYRENSLSQIRLDIARTFPSLGFFQEDGPYYDDLMKLLGAYACLRPSVGYLQSMAFIAAVLLLQMDLYPAFVAFANLLNRPLQTAFFELRQAEMTKYFVAYDRYMEQELPGLHHHLDKLDVRPDLYLIEWIYTLYAKSLPLDITCRVWDVYLRDGEEFIFETALGLLRMYESRLMTMDFDECVEFLTQLPVKMSCADLFRNIEPFVRAYSSTADNSRSRKRFAQILNEVGQRVDQGESNGRDFISRNLKEIKMSKSLSGFINDLLSSP